MRGTRKKQTTNTWPFWLTPRQLRHPLRRRRRCCAEKGAIFRPRFIFFIMLLKIKMNTHEEMYVRTFEMLIIPFTMQNKWKKTVFCTYMAVLIHCSLHYHRTRRLKTSSSIAVECMVSTRNQRVAFLKMSSISFLPLMASSNTSSTTVPSLSIPSFSSNDLVLNFSRPQRKL